MADLKITYKDDILDTSVNERRKYQMIQNEDGTVSFVDVTEYSQEGDSFGSSDINATNLAINELNSNLVSGYRIIDYSSKLGDAVNTCGSVTHSTCGNIVTIHFNSLQLKSLGTIITETIYKPIGDIYFLLHYSGSNTSASLPLLCKITTDGKVIATNGAVSNGNWYAGNVTFIKANE